MSVALQARHLLRALTPFGLVEERRRRLLLAGYGLWPDPGNRSTRELVELMNACNLALWPAALRSGHAGGWTLVDVGANRGEFAAAAVALAHPSRVVAFEPQESCYPSIHRALEGGIPYRLVGAAVGAREGTATLHRTANDRLSSLLEIRQEIRRAYGESETRSLETVEVPLTTLDHSLSDVESIGLLKIDVQGYELEVLRGAAQTLARTTAVLSEINYRQHYEGSASFEEIYPLLRDAGFALGGVSAPHGGPDGTPLWADAIFIREAEMRAAW